MCGIAGILSFTSSCNEQLLEKMSQAIAHRGPNGKGLFCSPDGIVGLAHRRLSIIDTSAAAAQPMHYLGRYTIVYNGEIYNYKELKSDLLKDGYVFTTTGDTEIIPALFHKYGVQCPTYLDGMFAFAIWDNETKSLFAARDRFGEKPFYYTHTENDFLFASEMKALWAAGIEKIPDQNMLANFLAFGQVQNPNDKSNTFYKNILSLKPGCWLLINTHNPVVRTEHYWQLSPQVQPISEKDAVDRFHELFLESIKLRLRSDMPVGASLSGGLDSSSIVSGIHSIANPTNFPVFSAVFPGYHKDESAYIKEVAAKFQLNPFYTTPTAINFEEDFLKLCYHQEEPFGSASIYAQYAVYEKAGKQQVLSLLDGQGADELLAGYDKYLHWYIQSLIRSGKISKAFNELSILRQYNRYVSMSISNIAAAFLPNKVANSLEKRELNKLTTQPHFTKEFKSLILQEASSYIHKPTVHSLNDILQFSFSKLGLEELLRHADRNSMAHGIEVRLPFLSHKLVEFVFNLPADLKIKNGFTKYILRKSVEHELPQNIVYRKDKIGFEPPQQQWLQSDEIKKLIQEARITLINAGILNPSMQYEPIIDQGSHAPNNYDWRYLVTAHTLFA